MYPPFCSFLTGVASFIVTISIWATPADNASAQDFNLTEVAPGLFVHQGKQVGLKSRQRDDIANIGFIVGKKCVAVIDTGGSPNIGEQLRNAIKETTKQPVCYIINTHVHFDHVLGNAAFKDDKPKFVGHHQLGAAVANSRKFFLDSFKRELGSNAKPQSIIGPNMPVNGSLEIDLGKRKLLLKAYPAAHTAQDLTLLDKKTNTLWLGDLLFVERIPALDGNLQGWLRILADLEKLEVKKVIPGHGPIVTNWPNAIEAERHYLTVLLNQTRRNIKKGGFLEEALEIVGQSEKDKWLLFDDHHKRNVSKAFTELEWE